MSITPPVADKVKELVEEIIAKNEMSTSPRIIYGPGADTGEGYNSKTLAVDVIDSRKELHLFMKMKSGLNWHESFDQMFSNETLFYNAIYPTYLTFLKEHNVSDGFRNAPKCYGATSDIIALDNLKLKNFTVFNNKGIMNEEHILLAMRILAKFHATSFAFKDQKKELHEHFRQKIHACVADIYRTAGFDKITGAYIKNLIKNLDPIRDKVLLEASVNLEGILIDALFNVDKNVNKYSIITQGDCWNNNVLFSYNEQNPHEPIDLMLVDWQLIRYASPAVDLSYFFYPLATESTIEKFEYYMKVYHDELSLQIRQLGSDPETLYPYEVFKEEWKRYVKYGFAMSFIILQGLLMEKDEIPDLGEDPDAYSRAENAIPKMRNADLFVARTKTLLKHFVEHEFL